MFEVLWYIVESKKQSAFRFFVFFSSSHVIWARQARSSGPFRHAGLGHLMTHHCYPLLRVPPLGDLYVTSNSELNSNSYHRLQLVTGDTFFLFGLKILKILLADCFYLLKESSLSYSQVSSVTRPCD